MAFGNRLAVIAADDPDGLRSQSHPGNAGDGKRARSCTADNDTAAETHDTARRRTERQRIGGSLARRFRGLRTAGNGFERSGPYCPPSVRLIRTDTKRDV